MPLISSKGRETDSRSNQGQPTYWWLEGQNAEDDDFPWNPRDALLALVAVIDSYHYFSAGVSLAIVTESFGRLT